MVDTPISNLGTFLRSEWEDGPVQPVYGGWVTPKVRVWLNGTELAARNFLARRCGALDGLISLGITPTSSVSSEPTITGHLNLGITITSQSENNIIEYGSSCLQVCPSSSVESTTDTSGLLSIGITITSEVEAMTNPIAWGEFTWNGSSITTINSHNVSSVNRISTGTFKVSFTSSPANNLYTVISQGGENISGFNFAIAQGYYTLQTNTDFTLYFANMFTSGPDDPKTFSFIVYM